MQRTIPSNSVEISNQSDILLDQFIKHSVQKASLMNTAIIDAAAELKLSVNDEISQTIHFLRHDKFQLRENNVELKENYLNLWMVNNMVGIENKSDILCDKYFKLTIFTLVNKIHEDDVKLRLKILYHLSGIKRSFQGRYRSWNSTDSSSIITCLMQLKAINSSDIAILKHLKPEFYSLEDYENAIQLLEKHPEALDSETNQLFFKFLVDFIQKNRYLKKSSIDKFESMINKLFTQFQKLISCDLRLEILDCKIYFLQGNTEDKDKIILAHIDYLKALNEQGLEKLKEDKVYTKTYEDRHSKYINAFQALSETCKENEISSHEASKTPITHSYLYGLASAFNKPDVSYTHITEQICIDNIYTFMLTNQRINDGGVLEAWRLCWEAHRVQALLELHVNEVTQNNKVYDIENKLAFIEKQLSFINNRVKLNRTSPYRFRFTIAPVATEIKINNSTDECVMESNEHSTELTAPSKKRRRFCGSGF